MLVSLSDVLRSAVRGRYAVGAFNTSNLEMTQAIIAAAVRERSPVIIATTEKALAYADRALPEIVRVLAERVPVPVVLHLDHGKDLRLIRWCLTHGYTSVMFDGSHLPFAQNVRATAAIVRLAHKRGISVEGELGTIGGKEDAVHARSLVLADPKEAKEFVQRTGVDILAAAFGSDHGGQLAGERLDFDRLAAVHRATSIPLAFHGASETPIPHIRRAIRLGVRKVNIDTDLRKAFGAAVQKTVTGAKTVYDPREILDPARDAVSAVARRYMKILGSSRRA